MYDKPISHRNKTVRYAIFCPTSDGRSISSSMDQIAKSIGIGSSRSLSASVTVDSLTRASGRFGRVVTIILIDQADMSISVQARTGISTDSHVERSLFSASAEYIESLVARARVMVLEMELMVTVRVLRWPRSLCRTKN